MPPLLVATVGGDDADPGTRSRLGAVPFAPSPPPVQPTGPAAASSPVAEGDRRRRHSVWPGIRHCTLRGGTNSAAALPVLAVAKARRLPPTPPWRNSPASLLRTWTPPQLPSAPGWSRRVQSAPPRHNPPHGGLSFFGGAGAGGQLLLGAAPSPSGIW